MTSAPFSLAQQASISTYANAPIARALDVVYDPLECLVFASNGEADVTWGIPTSLFLQIHVALSLIGIASGLIALYGLLTGKLSPGWTAIFLASTILTSVTGFPLPPFGFDPPRAIGILSLVLLAVAVIALYGLHLAGSWRWIYIVTALLALYLNSFVAVVQSFQKLPFLHSLAPTQSEAPFVIAQLAVLVAYAVLGTLALRKYQPAATPGQ